MDRGSLISDKGPVVGKVNKEEDLRIILEFNIQCKRAERIINKHWKIL